MTTLRLELPESVLDEIARRAAQLVLARLAEERPAGGAEPFMTVPEAAAYLRTSRQRIYDLLSARRLRRFKDGRRVLIAREDLDAYLAAGDGRRGRR